MKKARLFLVLLIVTGGLASICGSVRAQSPDSLYVPETGHWIKDEFLRTYESVSTPLVYFGNPITEDYLDTATHTRMQYFEKVRLDLVDTSKGMTVQVAPLGKTLHQQAGTVANIPDEGPTCRDFDSGFSVCYAFLQFYDAYNGSVWFGEPISKVEIEDGQYVQYFENVRMEWWPDRPSGQKVVLSDLGKIYFDQKVDDAELLKPVLVAVPDDKALNPSVNTFALKSLVGVDEQQTIYVILMDRTFKPIPGAHVSVTIDYPEGGKVEYQLPESNSLGLSQITFSVQDYPVQSTINVTAKISIRGETAEGKTWFRIWW